MKLLWRFPEKIRYALLGCLGLTFFAAGVYAFGHINKAQKIFDSINVPANRCVFYFDARVYLDSNGNSHYDIGEKGIAGVEVILVPEDDNIESLLSVTNSQGVASFVEIPQGVYLVNYVTTKEHFIKGQGDVLNYSSCEANLKSTWSVAATKQPSGAQVVAINLDKDVSIDSTDKGVEKEIIIPQYPTPSVPTFSLVIPTKTPSLDEVILTPVITIVSVSSTPTAVSITPPSNTPLPSSTPQPSATAPPTPISSATVTVTAVPTQTPTTAPTATATSTAVSTNTPTLPPPTSTATPIPTVTNTPLPTPTNTPTTAGYCPYSAGNGRFIIDFNAQMIRSDLSAADAMLEPISANIPAGTYRISLVSYDPDHALVDAASQPAEKWKLLLQNAEEATLFMSAPTGDLADDHLQQTYVVADEVFIAEGVAFGVAYHAAYPDDSSPNSIYPVCGILEQLTAAAPPTLTPSSTPALLVTPNPTVITPHD